MVCVTYTLEPEYEVAESQHILFVSEVEEYAHIHKAEAIGQSEAQPEVQILEADFQDSVGGKEDGDLDADEEPKVGHKGLGGGAHELLIVEAEEQEVAVDRQDDAVDDLGDLDDFLPIF